TSGAGCNALIKNGAYLVDCAQDILRGLGIEVEARVRTELEGDEREVAELLKREGELHAQKIALLLNKKLTDIVTVCSMLEIKGIIIRTGNNNYVAL
ncbi:MAG: hypothetical protein K2L72_04115, partial [Clostridia bacterium]|nr:hypothetical protein [Clostridia bacterium]